MNEGESCVLRDGESVDAARLQRSLQPNGSESVESHVEGEGHGVKTGDDEDHRSVDDTKWCEKDFGLQDIVSKPYKYEKRWSERLAISRHVTLA